PERTVSVGTVSKSLAPGMRLGWLVAPPGLAPAIADRKRLADLGTPVLEQLAFANLLESGACDRHVRRMRQRYRQRRDVLVAAAGRRLPEAGIVGVAAGIHVVLELPPGAGEADVVAAAGRRSVRVYGLGAYTMRAARPPALVLGYGALAPPALEAG